jgi:SAM-dependent MidA family methyltransferase
MTSRLRRAFPSDPVALPDPTSDATSVARGEGPHDSLTGGGAKPLAERLRERIRRAGPLTFRDWMSAALYDERGGYYRRADSVRWGRAGDYRTSPERSPLFAATFARYFAGLFDQLGRPRPFHLVEAGGGAGHFAFGLLQTLERDYPAAFDSLEYLFAEESAAARECAGQLLAPYSGRVRCVPPAELTERLGAGIVFSNELFDAFPVHRVLMRGGRLRELLVGLDAGGRFCWTEAEPSTPLLVEHFERLGVALDEGHAAEVNLEVERWLTLAVRILRRGFVVSVDYGDEAESLYRAPARREGTLRAFRRHSFAGDLLADPGAQDITATVNWTQIVAAGERAGLRFVGLERQDSFLLRAGLLEQLERECGVAGGGAEVMGLRLGAREMILPGGMAVNFQVLVQRKDGTP